MKPKSIPCLLVFFLSLGAAVATLAGEPRTTVFIYSLDGIRSDYIERADTPNLDALMAEGRFSLEAMPAFPSVTFSSHSGMSTGATPAVHGVTNNTFYDRETDRVYRFPGRQALLGAEPFWTAAARQGIRALVLDWVLAHQQEPPYQTAYFGEAYARGISDQERVQRVLDKWAADAPTQDPLRLITAYAESPDKEGHRYGPDAPEVEEAMTRADRLVGEVFAQAREIWKSQRQSPDELFYFIVASDHGMGHVHTQINVAMAADLADRPDVRIITGGNIANIFFSGTPEARAEKVAEALEALAEYAFIEAYAFDDLPEAWGYAHPSRTGDLVAVAQPGYSFNRGSRTVTRPTGPGAGPLGVHGYDPATDPNMTTIFIAHRSGGEPLDGKDLGRIELIQLHATVTSLLGVEAAETADSRVIDLGQK